MSRAAMRFVSTRGQCPPVAFREAVAQGLAPDGGLYLPEEVPDLSPELAGWADLPYPELVARFLAHFDDRVPDGDLAARVGRAHARFTHSEIAPLVRLADDLWVLELFHGPTLAFKDFALQILGELYEDQIARTGETINILGATSGDTGSAAIHGLLGKRGVRLFILYPEGRVSPLQERQMACTGADNVFPLAVAGSFDDAQRIVKEIFADGPFRRRHRLSAVNSINLARILAQCVYYFHAWSRLPAALRANVEVAVPTGNFGNVLAGWLAVRMGLPLSSLRVATNRNDILHRLFQTGRYEIGAVEPSHAPSMDIQVASNFERFLYYAEGRDPARVRAVMAEFGRTGLYQFDRFDGDLLTSSRCSDAEIEEQMALVHRQYRYVCDPHTACGFAHRPAGRPTVVLATAHPAKFPEVVGRATGHIPVHPSLEALRPLPLQRHLLPAETGAVRTFLEAHVG